MPSIVSSAEVGSAIRNGQRFSSASLVLMLPLVAFFVYVLSASGLPRGNVAGVYITAANIVEHGHFTLDGYLDALDPATRGTGVMPLAIPRVSYAAGHYYQPSPPGLALLAVPLYALGLLLAPILGPEAPALFVVLLGPLLGALAVALLSRAVGMVGVASPTARQRPLAWLLVLSGAALLLPLSGGPTLGLATVVFVTGVALLLRQLLAARGGGACAFMLGLISGAVVLLDYLLGAIALLLLGVLLVTLLVRQRQMVLVALAGAGAALGVLLLAVWQTLAFGYPWRLAFRAAADPVARGLAGFVTLPNLGALVLGVGFVALALGSEVRRPRWRSSILAVGGVFAFGGSALSWYGGRAALALPIHWWSPLPLLAATIVCALLLFLLVFAARGYHPRPRAAVPLLLSGLLVLPLPLLPPWAVVRGVAAAGGDEAATNYAAPFAIVANGTTRPLWTIEHGKGEAQPTSLRLEAAAVAIGPWLDVRPGEVYTLHLSGDGQLRATFAWEDVTRVSITTQGTLFGANNLGAARFAAPPGAAGLRLRLEAVGGTATARDLRLTLGGGVRVEPFPDGRRAALAFSFDWESAMGGLIHTRSDNMGEAGGVSLGSDGGPSVADAEEKGLRMRQGARFLADLFGRYGIKATFYATGYDLLVGNANCQKFNGDPIYRNADSAHGWGSDWWRTHRWYENDPCSTEAQAPAWYFASETRQLAAEGHEIASHSFGHLYVRGVTPEQLAADLALWQRSATALGLPPARSFAFPWTSSNSLDAPFWAAFDQVGMTILTRLYQTKEQPLRHPYELDRIPGAPKLIAFPDFYLASNTQAENEALARIDVTLAVRGYHSLWDHPNEALEQNGQEAWSRVIAYAAAQRDQGLWIAPVTEIATYGIATREVSLVALPLAGGTRLTIQNVTGRALDGLTLQVADGARSVGAGGRVGTDGQIICPMVAANAQLTVTARR